MCNTLKGPLPLLRGHVLGGPAHPNSFLGARLWHGTGVECLDGGAVPVWSQEAAPTLGPRAWEADGGPPHPTCPRAQGDGGRGREWLLGTAAPACRPFCVAAFVFSTFHSQRTWDLCAGGSLLRKGKLGKNWDLLGLWASDVHSSDRPAWGSLSPVEPGPGRLGTRCYGPVRPKEVTSGWPPHYSRRAWAAIHLELMKREP